jgi:hypothetical protein
MLLLSLNEALDRKAIDLLLALDKIESLMVSGEGVLSCSSLIAADLVTVKTDSSGIFSFGNQPYEAKYWIELSPKGRLLVTNWKRGNQIGIVENKDESA